MSNLFNESPRGDTVCNLTFAQLYKIVHDRIYYATRHGKSVDPDAVTQNAFVEIEKAMGIYPKRLVDNSRDSWG